jgi:hypothetical protein
VAHLPGHDGARDPLGLKGGDEPGKLAQRKPVDADPGILGGDPVHLLVGFLADGGDDHGLARRARGLEEQEGKAPVAGNQPQLHASG